MIQRITQLVKRLLFRRGISKARLSEEELKLVIDASTQSGAIDKTEHELIRSIMEFSDITVKEIMVPRPDISAVDISVPPNQLIRRVIEEGYSRYPVYRASIDTIVGVVYTKDLLSLLEHRNLIILQDIIRPALFVPESKKISHLLREFQASKTHLGIVVDEFGGTEGLVTIEDIIEEIVGEIHDEYDEVQKGPVTTTGGVSIVDGPMNIALFNEQFGATIPETSDYETLAGFLQKTSGKLPDVNEEIRYAEFIFVIVSKSARRIRQVRVTRVPPPVSPPESD
ncbi:MAG: hemolysin family protein [Bacteroidetes bacterium]|jgi:CBS domain containing-hemolysin-like protein|nr:hemolysin family protein [Bacteroidota bacterium]